MWMSHGKVRAEGKVNPIWVPLCSCPWAESQELPRKELGMEKKSNFPSTAGGLHWAPGWTQKTSTHSVFSGLRYRTISVIADIDLSGLGSREPIITESFNQSHINSAAVQFVICLGSDTGWGAASEND